MVNRHPNGLDKERSECIESAEKYPVELFSFALVPNHWHLVLRPQKDGHMGRLLRWVTATHSLRHHGHYGTRGVSHIYQSRFKSFPCRSVDGRQPWIRLKVSEKEN